MGWPSDVIAYYSLNTNANEDLNGWNGTPAAGCTFDNDGTYYYAYGMDGNINGRIDLPTDLWNALGAVSTWTIQFKTKRISTSEKVYGLIVANVPNSNYGMCCKPHFGVNVTQFCTTNGETAMSIPGFTTSAWSLNSIEYNGAAGKIRYYCDGSLLGELATANKFATGRTTERFALLAAQYSDQGAYLKMRAVVFSDTLYNGVEIEYGPDVSFLPCIDCADVNNSTIGDDCI